MRKILSIITAILVAVSTYLLIPPPQPSRAFEAQSTWGGNGGGSANAQTVAIANVGSLSDVLGVPLRYIPNIDNTGPATISINGLAATAVRRPSSIGLVGLSGGELQAGVTMTIMYNGATIEIQGPVDMTPIGKTVEYRGSATPRGALIEDGSCVSRVIYAALFAVISTSHGICDGATTFGLPFSNGRAFVAMDNQGTVTANVITSAGSGCNATVVGNCGTQNVTLLQTSLPNVSLAVSGSIPSLSIPSLTVNTSFNANAISVPVPQQGNWQGGAGSPITTAFSQGNNTASATVLNVTANSTVVSPTGSTVGNTTGSGSLVSGGTSGLGSGAPLTVLNPISVGRRAIKY